MTQSKTLVLPLVCAAAEGDTRNEQEVQVSTQVLRVLLPVLQWP